MKWKVCKYFCTDKNLRVASNMLHDQMFVGSDAAYFDTAHIRNCYTVVMSYTYTYRKAQSLYINNFTTVVFRSKK